MDRFAATMIARGPTFTGDGTLTGSVHILDLPDPEVARAFAFDEPGYQAGAYRDVLLRRWHNPLGRTMWEFGDGTPSHDRYLAGGPHPGPVRRGGGAPVAVRWASRLRPVRAAPYDGAS